MSDVAAARALTRDSMGMVRNHEGARLDGWIEDASGVPPELQALAEGLRRDTAAMTLEGATNSAAFEEYVELVLCPT